MTLSYKKRIRPLQRLVKLFIFGSLVILVAAVGVAVMKPRTLSQKKIPVGARSEVAPKSTPRAHQTQPTITVVPPKPVGFDKALYSISDPGSMWIIVNKKHPLPSVYVPTDLVQGYGGFVYSNRVNDDLMAMIQAARQDKVELSLDSAYRSYVSQQALYSSYIQKYGQATADTISARPGFSEHQTGLALDINDALNKACQFDTSCAASTSAGVWLAAHATLYGFIVRYTAGNEEVTGYSPEPWHVRYIGRELATEMQKDGISTLEDFFGVSGGNYEQ